MSNKSPEVITRYKYLYNSLALFAMDFDKLMKLDGLAFDVEFEMDTEFELGFDLRNINYLANNGIITGFIKDELMEFRSFIMNIPGPFWVISEFETNPVWNDVRRKADYVLNLLGTTDRDYDFSNTTIIEV